MSVFCIDVMKRIWPSSSRIILFDIVFSICFWY